MGRQRNELSALVTVSSQFLGELLNFEEMYTELKKFKDLIPRFCFSFDF